MLDGLSERLSLSRLIRTFLSLGEHLSIKVLTEGIETDEQQAWLLEMGCIESQGYLHSHPLSLKQLTVWLEERQRLNI
ncbi:EAL domain-containing protein [Marinomonas sp. 2405UD68-3]|uniref:EAL domain-containing protein n=1 Tax=Marinomonas sp. 2405UD68-3 TaxID=3391835 RepID=UPI0039C9D40D